LEFERFPDDIHPWSFSLAGEIDSSVLTHHILILLASDTKYFWVFVSLLSENRIVSLPESFYNRASNEALRYLEQNKKHKHIFQRSDTHSLIEHLTCQSLLSGNLDFYCCLRFLSFISDESQSLKNHLFISDLFIALDILLTPDSLDQNTQKFSFIVELSILCDNHQNSQQKLWTLIFCLLKSLKSKRLSDLERIRQLIPLITDSHFSQLVRLLTSPEIENTLGTHITLISSYVAISAVCSYEVGLLLQDLIKEKFTQIFSSFTPLSSTNKSRSLWHKDIIVIHYDPNTHQVLNYDMNPSNLNQKSLSFLTPLHNFDKVLVKEFKNHFVTIYDKLVYVDQLYSYFSFPISKTSLKFNFYDKTGRLLLVSNNFPQSLQHLAPSLLESLKILITKSCHKYAPIILNRTIKWETNKTYSIDFSPITQTLIDTTNSPSYNDILSIFIQFKQLQTTPFIYDHTKPLTVSVDSQKVLHLSFFTTNGDECDYTLESLALLSLSPQPTPLKPIKTQRHFPIAKNFNNINNQMNDQAKEIYVSKHLYNLITDDSHTQYQRGILKVFKKNYHFNCKTEDGYYLYKLFK
jgi:hypothetical protein